MSASLWGMARSLRECLASELIRRERPVCHLPIIWGSSPLPAQRCDCTCEGGGEGEGWVRVTTLAPIAAQARARTGGCGVLGWDVRVELGVWRCAPTPDDNLNPPTDAEYDRFAQAMFKDTMAIQAALTCCSWFQDKGISHAVDPITPSGPLGGCAGVIGATNVRFNGCGC